MKSKTPRGIRNNNPLNIRIGNTWLGETKEPTDSEFEQFISVKYGLRAAFCILRRYIRRYHRDTVRKIISAWAPASENDTELYIDFVAHQLGITADDTIRYEDEEKMCKLVKAMAKMECGQLIEDRIIVESYNMA